MNLVYLTPKPQRTDIVYLGKTVFSFDDIFFVVDRFYKKVESDPILMDPFSSVENWPDHIEKIAHFWWIRFGGGQYLDITYNPVQKHFEAGFNKNFLLHWLNLFHVTLEENLSLEQASIWKTLSSQMGESLNLRNEYVKKYYIESV